MVRSTKTMEARSEAQKVAAQRQLHWRHRARRLAPALAATIRVVSKTKSRAASGGCCRRGRERTHDSRSDRKNPIPHHKKGSIGHLLAQYSLASPSSSYYPDPFKVSKSVIKIDAAFWLTNVLPSISVPWTVKSFSLALSNFF